MSATRDDHARAARAAGWMVLRDLWDLLIYIGLMVGMLWAAHDGEIAWVLVSGFFLVLRELEKKRPR